MLQTSFFWGKYECPKFSDNNNPNFGIPTWECHLDVAPVKNHRIYYKEGSGASSQRVWIV
jgi:hypothetical protein